MSIFTPNWLVEMALLEPQCPEFYRSMKNQYYIRTAALIHSPGGSLTLLAKDLNIGFTALTSGYSQPSAQVQPHVATALNRLFGDDVLPRKLLRPDLFD